MNDFNNVAFVEQSVQPAIIKYHEKARIATSSIFHFRSSLEVEKASHRNM